MALAPWLIAYLLRNKVNVKFLITFVLIPLIGFGIFIGSWPYLWQDIFAGIERVFGFYKRTLVCTPIIDTSYIGPFNLNYYAIKWIISTTPPILLVLFVIQPDCVFIKN